MYTQNLVALKIGVSKRPFSSLSTKDGTVIGALHERSNAIG